MEEMQCSMLMSKDVAQSSKAVIYLVIDRKSMDKKKAQKIEKGQVSS